MADMIDDTSVPVTWVNAHTLAGITAGVAITINVKGAFPILAMVGNTAPLEGIASGYRMLPNTLWATDLGDTLWIRAESGITTASIQEK